MIRKSCIVWDITEELKKMASKGILERGLKQIASMNTDMANPDYAIQGEFRFIAFDMKDGSRRNILAFYDGKDRKPNIRTKKFITRFLFMVTKGTNSFHEREKPINMKHAYDLSIPYRIICGLDKKENPITFVEVIIRDLVENHVSHNSPKTATN